MLKHLVKKLMFVAMVVTVASPAFARDDVLHLSFEELLNSPEAKAKLDGSVKFYLAGQQTPQVLSLLGSDVSNPKTNGVSAPAVLRDLSPSRKRRHPFPTHPTETITSLWYTNDNPG